MLVLEIERPGRTARRTVFKGASHAGLTRRHRPSKHRAATVREQLSQSDQSGPPWRSGPGYLLSSQEVSTMSAYSLFGRRDFIRVGSLGALGISLEGVLRAGV